MYIPEFWCGVAALFIFEIVAAILYGIYSRDKNKEGDEE